ncbi:hypothetical protein [Planobispora longispora]|uniref:Uncharacterized protein n=1 Tax=Planobispora longispora TaxID=28887 RepID=A0A8J3W3R5_9ACTN|nr:hypothetical protein [Planobispora longispora]GIH75649.1 hypothetical protein Plo01_20780 [Planobispora longispora]
MRGGRTDRRRRRTARRLAGVLRRRRAWLLAGLGGLLVAAVAVVALAFPSVVAVTCPGCHGLEEVAPGLYTEPDLPPDRRRRAIEIVEAAGRRVHDFYGGRESAPRVLVCATDDCYRRIGGGGERGIAILNRAVMLSPRGANEVIAAHELSHVELDSRIGPGRVPRWFDEGLAVVVSGDPRYLAPETTPGTAAETDPKADPKAAPDRCLAEPGVALPGDPAGRPRAATDGERFYADSACRVSRWMSAAGGPAAVRRLIGRLAAGEEFAAVFPASAAGPPAQESTAQESTAVPGAGN